MSLLDRIVSRYLSLTEHSHATRVIVYAFTAFVVLSGIDLLWHIARWEWLPERVACNVVEAALLGIIAAYLSRLREERILRRQRELGFLNHHVRNALALIQMAEHQLDLGQRATAIRTASNRICSVLEQLSRDEDVSIDEQVPERFDRAG